jgi:hypothetical protein
VFSSAGLTAYYYREGAATAVSITLATMTVGTWATGGFKEIDATNMPGWYQLGIPDAALATGADSVQIHLKGAANMVPLPIEYQLQNLDIYDGVRAGLTALPNAAAGATGGLECQVTFGGTASAGSATTITLAGASAVDNYYNHQVVQITAGTGAGQSRTIVGYVGSTKVATVARAWATNPDNTSVFQLKGLETTPTWQLVAGTLSAATATTATLTGGVATNGYYNGALLVITAGTGQRQARVITGYVGGTTVATVDRAWATTPDNTSVYVVYGVDAPGTDANLAVAANSLPAAERTAISAALLASVLAELTQAQPPITPSVAQALMLAYMALRNNRLVTATTDSIENDAGVVIAKATVSDDGSTFTRAKMVSGP